MPTIYSAAQWPLQQSLNEVKHKSGLFTCTATFISPVGNSVLPTEIETSIGPVDVWPEPVVATGTDGFQTITATGYGVWDGSVSDVTYGYTLSRLMVYWSFRRPTSVQWRRAILPVILETVHVRKMGSAIPPLPVQGVVDPTVPNSPSITLRILDQTGADITKKLFNISEFDPYITNEGYTGTFEKTITTLIRPTMVKKNTFGTVIETEATYEFLLGIAVDSTSSNIIGTYLDFGNFNQVTPP